MPWAGLTALPADIEAAAKASRTIHYQRDRVRRWVAEEKDALVDEAVFLELAPDRGTAYVKGAVAHAMLAQAVTLLNAASLRTHTGKPWTADSLRKFMKTL